MNRDRDAIHALAAFDKQATPGLVKGALEKADGQGESFTAFAHCVAGCVAQYGPDITERALTAYLERGRVLTFITAVAKRAHENRVLKETLPLSGPASAKPAPRLNMPDEPVPCPPEIIKQLELQWNAPAAQEDEDERWF